MKCKFAWTEKKLTSIGSFNIKLLKICLFQFQFTSHSIHIQQKWEQLLMNASEIITTLFLPLMGCVKSLILPEAAIKRCSTKQELHSSKSFKVAGFQTLIIAAMWAILNAARFFNQPLAFTYRTVYIDFWIKILERLFVNDKQILTEILSIYNLFSPPSLKGLRHFSECYEFLVFIEIWTKFGPDEKRKGIPIPRCTSKEAALVYFE